MKTRQGALAICGREQVPGVALARPVAQVEMLRMGLAEGRRRRNARRVQLGAVLDRIGVVVGRVALGAWLMHAPVHLALSRITIAIPAITSVVPSTSGKVMGSPSRTTDEAMASNGMPSMPSDAVTGGSARATETAAQVAVGPATTPR